MTYNKEDRKSLFASQQCEDLINESKRFYKKQDEWLKATNTSYSKSKNYISKHFLQYIVEKFQDLYIFKLKISDIQEIVYDDIVYTNKDIKTILLKITSNEKNEDGEYVVIHPFTIKTADEEYYVKKMFTKNLSKKTEIVIDGYRASYKKEEHLEINWLFGKAMDIIIRHRITDRSFIQHNDNMKGCFYSNAMYRIREYTIGSYDRTKQTAFVYFTSTITNAFKEEINEYRSLISSSKKTAIDKGINGYIENIDSKYISDMEQDFDILHDITMHENKAPIFIQEIQKRFGELKKLSIELNPNGPRFARKKKVYDYFLPVTIRNDKEIGIVIKYVDIYYCNENQGQTKQALQNEILIARKEGHQTFYIFSDVYLDETIDDNLLYNRLKDMIVDIKNDGEYMYQNDLMFSYIPKIFIDRFEVTEPNWFWLEKELNKRGLPLSQDINEYINLKNIEPNGTRVWNAGLLDYNPFL